MYEDPKSKISQLEKILDAKEDLVSGKKNRHELHTKKVSTPTDWDNSEYEVGGEIVAPTIEKPNFNFSSKILIGSVVFFLLALILVAYRFFIGGNLVSGNNIELNIKAPVSISGGDLFSFEIEIKNKNNVTLSGADLGITFPIGARDSVDVSLPAKRVQDFIGDILPGQTVKKNLAVVLFGEENEKKDINILLEYKIAGSNSQFNKNKSFSVLISSAPVSIVIQGPKEVNTNQNVDFTVEIVSNSATLIKGLLLKAEYPFGFILKNSNPQTLTKNNLWLIGDLEPGARRTIKFSGVLSGQEGEERGFTFNLGTQSKSDEFLIDVPLTNSFSAITIRRPFVSADIFLNGVNQTEYVANAGQEVETVIRWQNNLQYEVSDVSLVVNISGNSVNKSSIKVTDGLYRSIDNTIIFNKNTNSKLANLQPGQNGESKFTFSSFGVNTVTGSGLINPTITLNVLVNGRRLDYGSGQENILFTDSRSIKITSNPQVFTKALYYTGPLQNTGPMPPKAEQETTYTITWTVTNPLNNLSNVRVSAILPPYIKWLNIVSPNKEKVIYDEDTGSVVWNVGNVSSGAGSISPAKEVSFQISFLPSVDQIKTSPNLIGESSLIAKDNFTLTNVSSYFSPLNTTLSNDPYFRVNDALVVQ